LMIVINSQTRFVQRPPTVPIADSQRFVCLK
jgi:hypothetical protein